MSSSLLLLVVEVVAAAFLIYSLSFITTHSGYHSVTFRWNMFHHWLEMIMSLDKTPNHVSFCLGKTWLMRDAIKAIKNLEKYSSVLTMIKINILSKNKIWR